MSEIIAIAFELYRVLQYHQTHPSSSSPIQQQQSLLDYLRKFLDENCCHEMETDWVDVSPETMQKVVYCKKCEYVQK